MTFGIGVMSADFQHLGTTLCISEKLNRCSITGIRQGKTIFIIFSEIPSEPTVLDFILLTAFDMIIGVAYLKYSL